MPDHKGRSHAALSRTLILSASLFVVGSPSAFAGEDHSYLPPWMREEAAGTGSGEQAQPPAVAAAVNIAKEGAREPSSGFSANAAAVRTKVVGFVSQLISRIGL